MAQVRVLSASVADGEELHGHKIQRVRAKAVSLSYFTFEKIGSIKSVVT